jgi:hypothetical protein
MKEIDDLRARIAALEEAAKPKAPFIPEPVVRWDPTEGMSMPPAVLAEMAPVGDATLRDVVADAKHSPTGCLGAAPKVRVGGR